jgi:3-dehydroquinate synthase/shikimate kinase/3-dehydroquinate synthase
LAVIVTDSNVAALYAERLTTTLARAGFQTGLVIVPAGEPSKSVAMLEYVTTGCFPLA